MKETHSFLMPDYFPIFPVKWGTAVLLAVWAGQYRYPCRIISICWVWIVPSLCETRSTAVFIYTITRPRNGMRALNLSITASAIFVCPMVAAGFMPKWERRFSQTFAAFIPGVSGMRMGFTNAPVPTVVKPFWKCCMRSRSQSHIPGKQ